MACTEVAMGGSIIYCYILQSCVRITLMFAPLQQNFCHYLLMINIHVRTTHKYVLLFIFTLNRNHFLRTA